MATTLTSPKRPLTWLITGSASGFGLALVRLAQAHGHTVIATSRNPDNVPELVQEVESKGGRWLALDVDNLDSGKVIANLEENGTPIDVLVNNAGWSIHGPAESFTEDETRREFDTVFFGPYRLMRAVVPYMRERRSGIIVNISSGAGLEGRESMGIYAAAKAAMDGVSKVLAKEIAPFNVRTLTVQLGAFNTPLATNVQFAQTPVPTDYKGSMCDKILTMARETGFPVDGDHLKAARAIYEVIVGEGLGEGKEGERVLPLGRDLAKRVDEVTEQWKRTMEVFGVVCNDVYVE